MPKERPNRRQNSTSRWIGLAILLIALFAFARWILGDWSAAAHELRYESLIGPDYSYSYARRHDQPDVLVVNGAADITTVMSRFSTQEQELRTELSEVDFSKEILIVLFSSTTDNAAGAIVVHRVQQTGFQVALEVERNDFGIGVGNPFTPAVAIRVARSEFSPRGPLKIVMLEQGTELASRDVVVWP